MTASKQAAFEKIINFQTFTAAILVLVLIFIFIECRYFLRRNPRSGALASYLMLIIAFFLYKMSAVNEDAKLFFSTGLFGLAISLIASIILSDPPQKRERPEDPIDEAIAKNFEKFRDRIQTILAEPMAPRHKELKIKIACEEIGKVLEAVKRIEARKKKDSAS